MAKAEQLARDIGLPFKRHSHSKQLLAPNQLLGSGIGSGFVTSYQRFRQEKKHTALKFGMDMVKEFGAHTSALSTLGLGVGTIGTAAVSAAAATGIGVSVTAALAVSATALALPAGIMVGIAMAPKALSALDAVLAANSKKYADLKARYL